MNNRVRWRVAAVLCAAIGISYLDRQALSVAIAAIQRDIPLTNTEFSQLQAAFLLAYALMYAGGGALVDRLGTRRGLLVIMIGWSLASASHGLATGFRSLLVSRFLLGVGEGGGFPAATKAVAEWFPARERSTGHGHHQRRHGGRRGRGPAGDRGDPRLARAGGWCSSPPARPGWSGPSGGCGVPPAAPHPGVSAAERHEIAEVLAPPPARPPMLVGAAAHLPQVWGLVLAKFLSDAAWYFYLFWLPKYLYDVRGFDVKQVGYYA